jgi:hypothetical protein
MERKFVAVIKYKDQGEFRSEPLEIHLARMAIADWKSSNQDKVNILLKSWLETMSMPPYLPEAKRRRQADKSEQEKTIEKYLQ